MSLKLIIIGIFQTASLATAQVFLKLAINRMAQVEWWTKAFFRELVYNWPLAVCGASFGVATLLWIYMLRHFDFSQSYPLTSLSYIFGMFAAAFLLGETIPATRWIGVVFIVIGVFFMIKQ